MPLPPGPHWAQRPAAPAQSGQSRMPVNRAVEALHWERPRQPQLAPRESPRDPPEPTQSRRTTPCRPTLRAPITAVGPRRPDITSLLVTGPWPLAASTANSPLLCSSGFLVLLCASCPQAGSVPPSSALELGGPSPRRATSPSHPVQSSLLRQTRVLLCSTVLRRAQRGTRPARLRPREGRPRAMSGRRHGWPPLCATCHRIPRTLRRGPGCRRPHGPHGSFAAEPRSLSSRDRGMSPWCHFVSGNGARVDTPTPKARKLCGGFHSSSHLCALRVVACLLRLGEHPSRQEPTTPWPAGRARGALNSPRAIGDVVVALFGRR